MPEIGLASSCPCPGCHKQLAVIFWGVGTGTRPEPPKSATMPVTANIYLGKPGAKVGACRAHAIASIHHSLQANPNCGGWLGRQTTGLSLMSYFSLPARQPSPRQGLFPL